MIESKEEVIIETAWQIKRNIAILNNDLKMGKIPKTLKGSLLVIQSLKICVFY